MITSVDSDGAVTVLLDMAESVRSNVDYLTKLDSQLGDGDHGYNLERGFAQVRASLSGFKGDDVGALLESIGNTLMSSMGGASGPLFGAAFSAAGRAVKGKEVRVIDVAAMLEAAEREVVSLGAAKVGDKTMLDSLHPAAVAARKASAEGSDMVAAFASIVAAAESGLESTKGLVAKKGRAMYLGERGVGAYDVGAASVCVILRSALETLKRMNEGSRAAVRPA